LKGLFRKRGVNNVENFPVSDLDLDEYCGMLFKAAKLLNKTCNTKGEKLFLQCSTGSSRTMTLIIVYLALFLKHP